MSEYIEPHPTIQALMDKAYERWQAPEAQWTYEQFLDQLSGHELMAVTLGNLNYQVNNGGFMQWIDNGYVNGYHQLQMSLKFLPKTEEIKTVSKLAEEAYEIHSRFSVPDNHLPSSHGWNNFNEDDEDLNDESYYHAIQHKDLDSRFYAVGQEYLNQVEAYFKAQGVQVPQTTPSA